MKQQLKRHISENLPFLKGKKLLIAISGGIDSVVLTHLFHGLKHNISLAHCNFSLRGKESNKDEAFVKNLGTQLSCKAHTIKFDTNKYAADNGLSTQMAARDLRYNWFYSLCDEFKYDYILTAHHKDDALETFLINMVRGTGLEGLTGIPAINGIIVRPLLPFDQNDILLFATKNKLIWREDESNSSLKYVRNRIRHKIVPVLKELNPSLLDSFTNTVNHLKGSQLIVHEKIEQLKSQSFKTDKNTKNIHIYIEPLLELHNKEVYLYELLKTYDFTAWEDISDLLTAQTGKQIFSKTHVLLKNRDELILSEINPELEVKTSFNISKKDKIITSPIHLEFKKVSAVKTETDLNPSEIYLDSDLLEFPLVLRKKQKGDFFHPIGMHGKKKISKYFKDQKFSAIDKQNTWLLCSGDAIVWVVGHRMDNRFKISASTKNILKIKS